MELKVQRAVLKMQASPVLILFIFKHPLTNKFPCRTPLASAHSNSELHLLAGGGGGARTAGDGQNGLVVISPPYPTDIPGYFF